MNWVLPEGLGIRLHSTDSSLKPPFLGLLYTWQVRGWALYGSGKPFLSGSCSDTGHSLGGHLGFFQFLTITNNSIQGKVYSIFWIISLGQMPRSEITVSKCMNVFMALEIHCLIAFPKCCTNSHCYRPWMPLSWQPHQSHVLSHCAEVRMLITKGKANPHCCSYISVKIIVSCVY